MTPFFSVVIPAYNYAHCLERAVNSVLAQSYTHFDVLVIDDGSTDNTPDVTDRLLATQDARLRCIRQNNAGLSAVRNRGIRETSGDWLVFLDADDELLPEGLKKLADVIVNQPNARLIIGNHDSDDGRTRKQTTPPLVSEENEKNFRAFLEKRLNISNGACAMHRSVFQTISYREDLPNNEDVPVFAHILACQNIAATQASISVIHKHADSWRHNFASVLEVGLNRLEAAIFDTDTLPDWAEKYRKPFRARRALFLVREAAKKKHVDVVRHFYLLALRTAPLQALPPRYIRRFLASFLRRGKQ